MRCRNRTVLAGIGRHRSASGWTRAERAGLDLDLDLDLDLVMEKGGTGTALRSRQGRGAAGRRDSAARGGVGGAGAL